MDSSEKFFESILQKQFDIQKKLQEYQLWKDPKVLEQINRLNTSVNELIKLISVEERKELEYKQFLQQQQQQLIKSHQKGDDTFYSFDVDRLNQQAQQQKRDSSKTQPNSYDQQYNNSREYSSQSGNQNFQEDKSNGNFLSSQSTQKKQNSQNDPEFVSRSSIRNTQIQQNNNQSQQRQIQNDERQINSDLQQRNQPQQYQSQQFAQNLSGNQRPSGYNEQLEQESYIAYRESQYSALEQGQYQQLQSNKSNNQGFQQKQSKKFQSQQSDQQTSQFQEKQKISQFQDYNNYGGEFQEQALQLKQQGEIESRYNSQPQKIDQKIVSCSQQQIQQSERFRSQNSQNQQAQLSIESKQQFQQKKNSIENSEFQELTSQQFQNFKFQQLENQQSSSNSPTKRKSQFEQQQEAFEYFQNQMKAKKQQQFDQQQQQQQQQQQDKIMHAQYNKQQFEDSQRPQNYEQSEVIDEYTSNSSHKIKIQEIPNKQPIALQQKKQTSLRINRPNFQYAVDQQTFIIMNNHKTNIGFRIIEDKVFEDDGKEGICSICLEEFFGDSIKQESYVIQLNCDHKFHYKCIQPTLGEYFVKCPNCNKIQGELIGDQPIGTMEHKIINKKCSGYDCSTIQITYDFPSGKKNNIPYTGTNRVAYLPNNTDGQKVLVLLKKAFQQKLLFTIGRSITTGRDNCVVWAGIHHKTSLDGGPTAFGYPDPTYFERVTSELREKGIV